MDEFSQLERRISAAKRLNAFDSEAVQLVVQLIRRAREAREHLDEHGLVLRKENGDRYENPAAKVERGASAELRGWVKDRPDLFGENRSAKPKREKFQGFKAV